MEQRDFIVTGQLLHLAQTHPDPATRAYAEATAKIAAEYGAEAAEGFLRGVWYVGGVKTVTRVFSKPGEWIPTYHDVIATLQPIFGVEIVRDVSADR